MKRATDTIFIVRQMMEKHLAKKKTLWFGCLTWNLREGIWYGSDRGRWWGGPWESSVYIWTGGWNRQCWHCSFGRAPWHHAASAWDSRSFEVKVGLHRGSVLSTILFEIEMDVVIDQMIGGLSCGLVLMAISREEWRRKLMKWRTTSTGRRSRWSVETYCQI